MEKEKILTIDFKSRKIISRNETIQLLAEETVDACEYESSCATARSFNQAINTSGRVAEVVETGDGSPRTAR